VLGQGWSGPSGVDETFVGQLQYPGKRFAQIASAFRTPWYTMAEVVGTEGRLHLNRPFTKLDRRRRLMLYPKDGEPRELTVPDEELYVGQVRDMHAQILDGAPPCIPLSETRDHVRTLVALHESARKRELVRLAK
jgi:predicted dehydrogenase